MAGRGVYPPTGFGERLRILREAAWMSQGELAREAGCAIYTVSRLERGLQEPSWPLVLAMATALNVEVTALVVTKTKRKQKE